MITMRYCDETGRQITDPVTVDWNKAILDEEIDLTQIVALLLLAVTTAEEESQECVQGLLTDVCYLLGLDGTCSFTGSNEFWQSVNTANINMFQYLRKLKKHSNPS